MVIGDVGADQQNHVGFLQVFVGAGRSVAAERSLVSGDGAGHAERRVTAIVLGAEADLRQLAERVEFLGDQLPGADDAEGVFAVFGLHGGELFHHCGERSVPTDAGELAVLAEHRVFGSRVGLDHVVFGKPLWAELAVVHRMILITANRDRLAVLDANQHAAADRAVAAGSGNPVIRNLLG